jgi:hypothetical protein
VQLGRLRKKINVYRVHGRAAKNIILYTPYYIIILSIFAQSCTRQGCNIFSKIRTYLGISTHSGVAARTSSNYQ